MRPDEIFTLRFVIAYLLMLPFLWGKLFLDNPKDELTALMLCFLGWNWCLARLGTVRATNFIYLNPVIAIVSSAIVLDEHITWIAVTGAVLILGGLIYIDRHRQR